ncbi:MAG: putative Zn-dependent protease [Alphaproteobacteria bacterium]
MTEYSGHFNDGETARRFAVTVRLESTTLLILIDTEGSRESWPLSDLHFVGETFGGGAVRLKRGADGVARLTINDGDFLHALLQAAPHLRTNPNLNWRRITLMTLAVAASAALLYFSFPKMVDLATNLIPRAWERNLGKEMVVEVAALMGAKGDFCDNPAGLVAFNKMTSRLTAAAASLDGGAGFADEITIRTANSPQRNAFAVFGGQIAVLNGLLFNAQSPDEVAGVIAHEIGHVAHRHPARKFARSVGLGLVFEFLLGGGRTVGFGETLLTLSYGREAEREADNTALAILDAAQISTKGLADFLDRLGHKGAGWLSSHPNSDERAAAIRAHQGPAETTPALSPSDWRALNGICQSPSSG